MVRERPDTFRTGWLAGARVGAAARALGGGGGQRRPGAGGGARSRSQIAGGGGCAHLRPAVTGWVADGGVH